MSNTFKIASVKHHTWGSVVTFNPLDANNPAQTVAVTFNPDESIQGLKVGEEIQIEFKSNSKRANQANPSNQLAANQ